jgi:hypothetical protein
MKLESSRSRLFGGTAPGRRNGRTTGRADAANGKPRWTVTRRTGRLVSLIYLAAIQAQGRLSCLDADFQRVPLLGCRCRRDTLRCASRVLPRFECLTVHGVQGAGTFFSLLKSTLGEPSLTDVTHSSHRSARTSACSERTSSRHWLICPRKSGRRLKNGE